MSVRLGPFSQINLKAVVYRPPHHASFRGQIPDIGAFDRRGHDQQNRTARSLRSVEPQTYSRSRQDDSINALIRSQADAVQHITLELAYLVEGFNPPAGSVHVVGLGRAY